MKCIFPMSLPQQKRCENFAKTFQAMIQEIFLNGFRITFRDIFLLGVEIFFYIFSLIKKSFPEIFLKSFRNISENISLERVCKKNFREALKILAIIFLNVLFRDVHKVSKTLQQLCKHFRQWPKIFLKGFLITLREIFLQRFGNNFLHF